jgi:DNA-binding transcriptional LysR family regulator
MNTESLDPRRLEAFIAVISSGSMTGAARMLGRSQPAVTRLIQDLEADLGFELLHRNGPRITPTDRGVRFYEEAERIMTGLRHLRDRANAIAQEQPQAIEIVATHALAAGIVPAALARLDADRFPANVLYRSCSAEQVVQSVLSRTAEIGLSSLPIDHPGLEVHWIVEAPCVAVVRLDDPLARRDRISLTDLAARRLITVGNPYRLRRSIDQALASAGVVIGSVIETNASINALLAARAGLGVAVIEPATAFGVPVEGVVTRPLATHIPSFWGLVSPLAKPLSPEALALIEAVKATATALIPNMRLHDPSTRENLAELFYASEATPALQERLGSAR